MGRSPHKKSKSSSISSREDRRTWMVLGAILLLGLFLRISYLSEIKQAPDFSAPLADAAFHDYWARAMLSGDWTVPEGLPDPRIREVPYLRPPGYPYFLAGAYALTGRSYTGARIVQMILGLVNCVLAYLLGKVVFQRTIGLILAAFCAVYWSLVYFEGELHAPTILITLSLLLILLLHNWSHKPGYLKAVLAGVILGALSLVRANFLLFIPVAAGWMIWCARRQSGTGTSLRQVSIFILGAAITISPATFRNAIVAEDTFLVSANGAINLYIGNNEISDGVSTKIPGLTDLSGTAEWSCFSYDAIVQELSKQEGRDLKYSDVSDYFRRKATDFITGNPLRFVGLTLKRAALFWGPAEISNNKAIKYEKANSTTLRFFPGFPFVVAVSLIGLALVVMNIFMNRRIARAGGPTHLPGDLQQGKTLVLVGLFVLTIFASYLPFIIASRFRVPLTPFMFLFGAYAVYRFGLSVAAKDWRRVGTLFGAGLGLYFLASLSLAGYDTDPAWWHTDRALAYNNQGEIAEAEAEFKAALRANPGFVDAHIYYGEFLADNARGAEAIQHFDLVVRHRPSRLDVRLRLATLLIDEDRAEEAIVHLRQITRSSSDFMEARFELGRALNHSGKYEESIEVFRLYLENNPDEPAAYLNIGIALMNLERPQEAIREIRQAIIKKPDFPEAYVWLGKAYAKTGSVEQAVDAFQQAIRSAPEMIDPLLNLGLLYSQRSEYDKAAEWYRQAVQLDKKNLVARHNYAGALANGGRYDEAITELEVILRIDPTNQVAKQRLTRLRQLKAQQ